MLGLKRYALYVFDYGAPTGFRLAMAQPERVTAIISQTGMPMKRVWAMRGHLYDATGMTQAMRIGQHFVKLLDPMAYGRNTRLGFLILSRLRLMVTRSTRP